MDYSNPVLPGTHPDPTVCRVGEDYYLAVSSFEYVPGLPLYHSRDLVTWERIGDCLTRADQLDLRERDAQSNIFAPTLRHHDGTFYLITTDTGGIGHFVITADDPRGEWSDPTPIDAGGIDPDLFFADDGTTYLQWTDGPSVPEFRVRQAEVDLATGDVGEPRQLWQGIEGGFAEAPHLYERDGAYYLIAAEGGTHTNHMVTVGRSDDPTGPFEPCPDNPILTHRGHPMKTIKALGHADLVTAPDGSWWLICLGIRQHGGHPGWHHLGRETFLAPVTWEEGWPVVNDGEPLEAEMDAPLPNPPSDGRSDPDRPLETTFDAEGRPLGWHVRHYSVPERCDFSGEGLELVGGTPTLADPAATFVGRPQSHFDCDVETTLQIDPAPDEEAGIAAFTDERHYYTLGVRGTDDGPVATVRLRIGDATDVVAERPVDSDTHRLSIGATAEEYTFADGAGGDLASAASRYLATEVAGGFTGVFLGPYALSEDGASGGARVESFSYVPRR